MQDIRAAVAREFDLVNELIIEQLHSDVSMVENVGHYIVDAGGKRLRPLLALLSAAALGKCSDAQIKFAATIEFIHTATLLHDDVVDISTLRRGQPTANAEFGNAPSILVGDFLYTRAFQLMVELDNRELLAHMADTTNVIAEGEVLQLVRAGDPETTEAQYLDVITRKTAVLFASSCFGSAALAAAPEALKQNLREFGLNLGIAFQMVDDLLDYEGESAQMGKNVGDDLAEGKMTLPLIHALAVVTSAEQALIRESVTNKSSDQLEAVVTAVQRCGSLDYTREQATIYSEAAASNLAELPDSDAKKSMAALIERAVNRDH